jgi:ubiquinone biosynthesis protein COQ9
MSTTRGIPRAATLAGSGKGAPARTGAQSRAKRRERRRTTQGGETEGYDQMTDDSNANETHGEQDLIETTRETLLLAMTPHVPFDGWSKAAIDMAVADSNTAPGLAALAFPRGGLDAALAFHRRGDRLMAETMAAAPLHAMKIREKVTFAVRTRLELAEEDREAVRRAASLLALPMHAGDTARAMWGTADAIWTAMGDESRDINWYSKRATLTGVYSAVALYWLADESEGRADSWAFLDRRIADVMKIEKVKAQVRGSALGKAVGSLFGGGSGGAAAMGGAAERAAAAMRGGRSEAPTGRRFGFPGPRR